MIRATSWFAAVLLLLMASLVLAAVPAWAADAEEPDLSFFYPLVTRRPVVERELEFGVSHFKGREGRETRAFGAVELPILRWWQVELEIPLIFNDPRHDVFQGGVGDIALENKFLVFKSVEHKAQVATGFEVRFPTGSERRGLGGEAAIEPFITAGIALGDFDLLADVAWEFNINSHVHGPNEQEFTGGIGVAYRFHRLFSPLVELRTATVTRGEEDDELLHRTRVTIIPGFNTRPFHGTTFLFGVELPLTSARSFDYALHGAMVWEF
jgi:hypothetical protein